MNHLITIGCVGLLAVFGYAIIVFPESGNRVTEKTDSSKGSVTTHDLTTANTADFNKTSIHTSVDQPENITTTAPQETVSKASASTESLQPKKSSNPVVLISKKDETPATEPQEQSNFPKELGPETSPKEEESTEYRTTPITESLPSDSTEDEKKPKIARRSPPEKESSDLEAAKLQPNSPFIGPRFIRMKVGEESLTRFRFNASTLPILTISHPGLELDFNELSGELRYTPNSTGIHSLQLEVNTANGSYSHPIILEVYE